jgi:hypothetical protein
MSSLDLIGALTIVLLTLLLALVAFGLGYIIDRDQRIRISTNQSSPTPATAPLETEPHGNSINEDSKNPQEQHSRSVSNTTAVADEVIKMDLDEDLDKDMVREFQGKFEETLNENESLRMYVAQFQAFIDEKDQEIIGYRNEFERQGALEASRVEVIRSQRATIDHCEQHIAELSVELRKVTQTLDDTRIAYERAIEQSYTKLKQSQNTIAEQSLELNKFESTIGGADPVRPDHAVLQKTIEALEKENSQLKDKVKGHERLPCTQQDGVYLANLESEAYTLREESEKQFDMLERKDKEIKSQQIKLKTLQKQLSEKPQSLDPNEDVELYKYHLNVYARKLSDMEAEKNRILSEAERSDQKWRSEYISVLQYTKGVENEYKDFASRVAVLQSYLGQRNRIILILAGLHFGLQTEAQLNDKDIDVLEDIVRHELRLPRESNDDPELLSYINPQYNVNPAMMFEGDVPMDEQNQGQ